MKGKPQAKVHVHKEASHFALGNAMFDPPDIVMFTPGRALGATEGIGCAFIPEPKPLNPRRD
jgi:hypothetical protein